MNPVRCTQRTTHRARTGFTLVELMIAVAVLIVVLVAISKIFGTVSRVASVGEANADVLQESVAIERQIRTDLEQLSYDGYFVIRCVALPNDINLGGGGGLLNPLLPPTAIIRADQLVFFRSGVQVSQQFVGSSNLAVSGGLGQAAIARMYYGHGFRLDNAVEDSDPIGFNGGEPLAPWVLDPNPAGGSLDMESTAGNFLGPINGSQPGPLGWVLARQPILLADDAGQVDSYLANFNNATATIWDNAVRNSRVDVAASQLDDIRTNVQFYDTGGGSLSPREWRVNSPSNPDFDQRTIITESIFYPRSEKVAKSMQREEQFLTMPSLAVACSSFRIEWTYDDGVGAVVDGAGNFIPGMQFPPDAERPWFGMPDPAALISSGNAVTDTDHAVGPAGSVDFQNFAQFGVAASIFGGEDVPNNIEDAYVVSYGAPSRDFAVYEATFGYNRSDPFDGTGTLDLARGYTPWPTALRITMTLHDTEATLERGREVQFVINLPRRGG